VSTLRLLLASFALSVLVSLVCIHGYSSTSSNPGKTEFANATSFNVTVKIFSCKGEKIAAEYLKYLTVELKGSNQTWPFQDQDTLLVTIPAGNYSLIVKYLGFLVYKGEIPVYNSTEVSVRANISKVQFRAIDLMMRGIQGYELSVSALKLSPRTGDTVDVWLPFGNLQYSVTYRWGNYGNVTKSGNVIVSCDTPPVVVPLPVWSQLVLNFRLADGSSALGLNGSAEVYYSSVLVSRVDFLSQDALKLQGAITGDYTLRIYLHGKKIAETVIAVDNRSWNYTVTVGVMRNIMLRLFDASGKPLVSQDLTVTVVTPLGETRSYTLSGSNTLEIAEGVPGSYSLTVTSSVVGQLYSDRVNVRDLISDIQLPLVFTYVVFKPEGSSTIPRGVSAKAFYIQGGKEILLWSTSSLSEGNEGYKTVLLGVLPLGGNVRVEVSYAGAQSSTLTSVGGSGIIESTIPVYDFAVRVIDKNKAPVTGCLVNVSAGALSVSGTVRDGQVFFKNLPRADARVIVQCSNVLVADQVINTDIRNATIQVPLVSFKVSVKSWFNRPITGAEVQVEVLSGNKTLFTTHDVTDQGGNALFSSVPAPPGATLRVKVVYGSSSYTQRLSGEEREVTVFLDILVDTPLLKLTLLQTVTVIGAATIVSVAGLIAYKKYSAISTFKHMFEAGAGEEEEESESFIEKLRNIFRRRKEEEKEEEGLFF